MSLLLRLLAYPAYGAMLLGFFFEGIFKDGPELRRQRADDARIKNG